MHLLPVDCVILGVAAVAAIIGLLCGFSGALAFLLGTVGSALAGRLCWQESVLWLDATWSRALMTAAGALVAFGLVRIIVRKVVHGILAQPADAIFGALVAALSGFALATGAAFLLQYANLMPVKSALLDWVTETIGENAN